MNKKNRLLTALVLSTTCLLSLAGCKGEQGIKGDTGEKGDQGQKGDSGTPGKDGENGKDGASLLNGEGAPSDTLGNDGDTYIDSLTFDLYIKDNGKWVLKGNTKGDKGDQGEKGDTGSKGDKGDTGSKGDKGNTGSSGSQGTKGDTAWSNTILYSEYGYITPSAASMIANNSNKISFTVHHNDYSNARFSKLILRNPKLSDDGELVINASDTEEFKIDESNHDYTYETTMLEGGFVVSAEFVTKEKVDISNENTTECNVTSKAEYCFVGDDVELTVTPTSDSYRLKVGDNDKYWITINEQKVEVTKDGNKYTCTVTMVKDGFTVSGVFESKKSISYNNEPSNGGSVTTEGNITSAFVGEEVKFIIKANPGYELKADEFKINSGKVSVTYSEELQAYTCSYTMVEDGLSVYAEWDQLLKANVGSPSNGTIEVYSYDSSLEQYNDTPVDCSKTYFKKGDKIKVKFIPKTFTDLPITVSLSNVTIDSTTLNIGNEKLKVIVVIVRKLNLIVLTLV